MANLFKQNTVMSRFFNCHIGAVVFNIFKFIEAFIFVAMYKIAKYVTMLGNISNFIHCHSLEYSLI